MNAKLVSPDFINGLVFGFDLGTGSIGYAVRKADKFLDVGVLICPEETNDLSGRRALRRQRRTLRSRKYRRAWFAKELEKIGLPKPAQPPHDPITLRLRALTGEKLEPAQLHSALSHLFKRRGHTEVPWANRETTAKANEKEKAKEEGVIKERIKELKEKLGGLLPCQFLARRQQEVGGSPTESWARKIYWPRELLEKEFREIAAAQAAHYPELSKKTDWLLYGDSREVKGHRVFFNAAGSRNPGVLGLRWPRFDNRGPALDSLQPVDESGRPLHVVRKNKQAFAKAQWELALMNFRVLDSNTREKLDPRIYFPVFIENLRNEWNKKGKVTQARLLKLAEPFKAKFLLVENQKPLTPETGSGRARYSSPTLEFIQREIAAGKRVDPPQPILRRKGETPEEAVNRYLADIKHPLVRHRLVLFRRMLARLARRFGEPDMIVLEVVRSLALSQKHKNELNKRNEEFRKQRLNARENLAANNESTSRNAIQRYRLWQEAKGRCPFCLESIARTALGHGADIEHLVPRSVVDCNEFYNLTVAHDKCNRELKADRTPFDAFSGTSRWSDIKDNAEKTFSGRKLEIFLSPKAEELIEQKADLQHTAYIARVIRHVALTQLAWLGNDGRDPTPEKQNPALRFQVTNGQLTSRLRKAWGLNQILHPLPAGTQWADLPEVEQKQFTEKNRGDLRHHALDAMVIACTLPWLAHRTHGATDEFGNHGWWTQDEKQRSKAANPIFPREGQMHEAAKKEIEKVVVRHHQSRSKHQQAYATTIYGRLSSDTYAAREKLTDLKQADFRDVHPKELGVYLGAAWEKFKQETPGLDSILKKTANKLPQAFIERLCFSHFQKWREDKAPAFDWPEAVQIPIRSVKLIAPVNDDSVLRFAPGTLGFVKRTTFKEVHIYPAKDRKGFVPVFVPYWKGDKPLGIEQAMPASKPVAILRKRTIIKTVKPLSTGHPPGSYCLYELGQVQPYLLPPHIAKKEEAMASFGIKKSGIKPRWPDLIRALGYELPHPPSVKPESPGPPKA